MNERILSVLMVLVLAAGAGAQTRGEVLFTITEFRAVFISERDAQTFKALREVPLDNFPRGLAGAGDRIDALYSTAMVDGVHNMVKIDKQSGDMTPVGPTGLFINPGEVHLLLDPLTGDYYMVTPAFLFLLDVETGHAELIRQFDFGGVDAAAAAAIGPDGQAYLIDAGFADLQANLYSLSLNDGGLTPLGDLGYLENFYTAMGFRSDGRLFGGRRNGEIWEIDVGSVTDELAVAGDGASIFGWWFEGESEECYPDFTGDGVLDLFDFLGYVNTFNAGGDAADCDGNGPLDLFDFLCFVNAFNAGC